MKRCIATILIVVTIAFAGLQTVSADENEITVEAGDTCWSLAERMTGDGTKFVELYQENSAAIEDEAKIRGFESSDFCHWIFPGMRLRTEMWSKSEGESVRAVTPSPVSTPLPTTSPVVTSTFVSTPINSVVPTVVPMAEPTAVPVRETEETWLWLLLIATVIALLIAVILRHRNNQTPIVLPEEKKEEKVFRPTRQEMLDATKLNSRFGSYNAEQHKQLVVELDQKAALVAAALRSFGSVADEVTRQKIMEAPREQLREQQLMTAWVLQSMGLLNSDGTVTLYRGFRDEVVARNIAGSGRVGRVSSFTLNRSTAQSFDGGGVIVARVPIELIAGSYLTCSYPHRSECEVTIMPGQVNGARYYKSHEVPEVIKAPAAPVL